MRIMVVITAHRYGGRHSHTAVHRARRITGHQHSPTRTLNQPTSHSENTKQMQPAIDITRHTTSSSMELRFSKGRSRVGMRSLEVEGFLNRLYCRQDLEQPLKTSDGDESIALRQADIYVLLSTLTRRKSQFSNDGRARHVLALRSSLL